MIGWTESIERRDDWDEEGRSMKRILMSRKEAWKREDTWWVRGSSLRAGGGGEAEDDVVTSRVREITRDNILEVQSAGHNVTSVYNVYSD